MLNKKSIQVLSCSHFSETSHTTVKAATTSPFEYVQYVIHAFVTFPSLELIIFQNDRKLFHIQYIIETVPRS